jgi:hypothetical protein
LILGCSPNLVIMPPVPSFPTLCPGITTHDSIGGNVTPDQALAVIFHTNTIKGNLSVHGGGGGANCNVDPNLSVVLDSKLGPTPELQAMPSSCATARSSLKPTAPGSIPNNHAATGLDRASLP